MGLDEKYYSEYLQKAYFYKTGFKLNLKKPKSLNEKIQWLKLFDNMPIKDWVKNKIGEKYLKPVLQICDRFSEINFNKFPESFIIKCNHGCKWHILIKNKEAFLSNERLYVAIKKQITNWLSYSFFGYSDFETQYKNIVPKIIIEPLLSEEANLERNDGIYVYCFNSNPVIFDTYRFDMKQNNRVFATFDSNFKPANIFRKDQDEKLNNESEELLKKTAELSRVLSKDFKFVRIDWFIFKNKLYFEEMTFTPCSGYINFDIKNMDEKLGKMLNLKGS